MNLKSYWKTVLISLEWLQNTAHSLILALVKHFTKNFGSPAIKKELNKYKKRFQDYAKRRICECPSNAFGDTEALEKVYRIKIEEDINTLTVEELGKLEYEMNKILGHKFLRLLNFKEGCVELIFRTFGDNELNITDKQHQALGKLKVLSIAYGNEITTILDIDKISGKFATSDYTMRIILCILI